MSKTEKSRTKEELMEIAKKIGVKTDNFEFAWKKDEQKTRKQFEDVSEFMGL